MPTWPVLLKEKLSQQVEKGDQEDQLKENNIGEYKFLSYSLLDLHQPSMPTLSKTPSIRLTHTQPIISLLLLQTLCRRLKKKFRLKTMISTSPKKMTDSTT